MLRCFRIRLSCWLLFFFLSVPQFRLRVLVFRKFFKKITERKFTLALISERLNFSDLEANTTPWADSVIVDLFHFIFTFHSLISLQEHYTQTWIIQLIRTKNWLKPLDICGHIKVRIQNPCVVVWYKVNLKDRDR